MICSHQFRVSIAVEITCEYGSRTTQKLKRSRITPWVAKVTLSIAEKDRKVVRTTIANREIQMSVVVKISDSNRLWITSNWNRRKIRFAECAISQTKHEIDVFRIGVDGRKVHKSIFVKVASDYRCCSMISIDYRCDQLERHAGRLESDRQVVSPTGFAEICRTGGSYSNHISVSG